MHDFSQLQNGTFQKKKDKKVKKGFLFKKIVVNFVTQKDHMLERLPLRDLIDVPQKGDFS